MQEIIRSGELGNCGTIALKTAEGIDLEELALLPVGQSRPDIQDHDDQLGLSLSTCQMSHMRLHL